MFLFISLSSIFFIYFLLRGDCFQNKHEEIKTYDIEIGTCDVNGKDFVTSDINTHLFRIPTYKLKINTSILFPISQTYCVQIPPIKVKNEKKLLIDSNSHRHLAFKFCHWESVVAEEMNICHWSNTKHVENNCESGLMIFNELSGILRLMKNDTFQNGDHFKELDSQQLLFSQINFNVSH
jgi:hypothetical protein